MSLLKILRHKNRKIFVLSNEALLTTLFKTYLSTKHAKLMYSNQKSTVTKPQPQTYNLIAIVYASLMLLRRIHKKKKNENAKSRILTLFFTNNDLTVIN